MEPIDNSYSISRPYNNPDVVGVVFEDDGGISTVVAPEHVLPQMWLPTVEQITIGHSSLMMETNGPQVGTQALLWNLLDSYPSLRTLAGPMSRLLTSVSADQARDLKEAMTELSRVLPYGELPVVGGEVEQPPAPRARAETLKLISARAGLRHVYVLPGHLVDFVLSCPQVQMDPSHEGIILRFGKRLVVVPPAGQMQQENLLELYRFAKHLCPTLIVLSGVMEQVVRTGFLLFGYSYKNGIPDCSTMAQAVQRCAKLAPELLVKGDFVPEVASFAELFRERILSRKAGCDPAEPHVVAAATLVDDPKLQELFRRLSDMQKVLPDPVLGLLQMAKMPKFDVASLITEAASSSNRTSVNPMFDPVAQGAFGSRVGRVLELCSVIHQMKVPDVSDVVVITGAHGMRSVHLSELPVRVKHLYAANYGHSDVVNEVSSVASRESCVIIDRGFAGDPRYQVSSVADLENVQGLYRDFAKALVTGSAAQIAMCGPLTIWKTIPDWISQLGAKYDITIDRVGMDCTPFVWVRGTRNIMGTGSTDLKEKLQSAIEDLYVRVIIRKSLMMRGQPSISLEANPMRLKKQPVYLVQFTGVPNLDAGNKVASRVHSVLIACTHLYKAWNALRVQCTRPVFQGVDIKYL